MLHFDRGYEAPSTAHENPGHPSLEIGGCQHLALLPAYTVLPQSVTLKVKCIPIACAKDIRLSLSDHDVKSIPIYTRYPAIERIEFWLEKEGHHYLYQGTRKPLDSDPQWDALLRDKPFYSMIFRTLEEDISLSSQDNFVPYGGCFALDPAQCKQRYLKATWSEGQMEINTREDPHTSLKSIIEAQKIEIFITYYDTTYAYKSVAYTLTQENRLFIEFIASF